MRRAGLIAIGLVIVLAALATGAVLTLRGDGAEASDEPIQVTPPAGTGSIIVAGAEQTTAAPIARLPGITVIGSGEVEVKPDTALVRLTVGSGSVFAGSNRSVEFVDEKKLERVVEALADAGVRKDDIYVNTFSGVGYGPTEGAAVITLMWPRPREVKKILTTAQRAIRKETDYNLQDVAVAFMRGECDAPEQKATRAALVDARKRAERLASLSHAKVGRLNAVSESTSAASLAYFAPQRCGVSNPLGLGLFEYQAAAATPDEITLTTTLEVTFALEQ